MSKSNEINSKPEFINKPSACLIARVTRPIILVKSSSCSVSDAD